MKRTVVACIFISAVVSYLSVFSQEPRDISLEPDFEKETVVITVIHPVVNPKKHYIRQIDIQVGDKEIVTKRFFFQKGDQQTLLVALPGLKDIQRISIKAYPTAGAYLEKVFDIQSLKEREQ